MNTQHTPAPWTYFLDESKFTIIDQNKEYIASTYSIAGDEGGYTENANAELLSKACYIPEMVEALKLAITALDMDDEFGNDIDARHDAESHAFEQIYAILGKLEGSGVPAPAPAKEKPRVLLTIEGGVLQNIDSTTGDIDIHLIDHDVLRDMTDMERIEEEIRANCGINVVTSEEISAAIESRVAEYRTTIEANKIQ